MKINETASYCISKSPVANLIKGAAIWLNNGSTSYPIVYLRKPKGISKECFDEILDTITINMTRELYEKTISNI